MGPARSLRLLWLAWLGLMAWPSAARAELLASHGDGTFYRIDVATGIPTRAGYFGGYHVPTIAIDLSGTIWFAGLTQATYEAYLGTYDLATGVVAQGPRIWPWPYELAFSPDGTLFAVRSDALYTIDVQSGATTLIGETGLPDGHPITGLAFSPKGTLYAWDSGSAGKLGLGLVTVDPFTGVATDVDSAIDAPIFPPVAVAALAFAPDGRLYGAYYDLYTVEPSSGALTLIGRIGDISAGVGSMVWIPEPSTPTALLTLAAAALLVHLCWRRKTQ
jgi:hypothetical protein